MYLCILYIQHVTQTAFYFYFAHFQSAVTFAGTRVDV